VRQYFTAIASPAWFSVLMDDLQSWAERERRSLTGGVRLVYHFDLARRDRGPDIDVAVPLH
jgi:hypothetical protein